jgi:hypothetical protein
MTSPHISRRGRGDDEPEDVGRGPTPAAQEAFLRDLVCLLLRLAGATDDDLEPMLGADCDGCPTRIAWLDRTARRLLGGD